METRIVLTGILKDDDLFLAVKRNENDDMFLGAWEFLGGHLGEVRKAYSSILNENNLIYIDGMKPIEQIFNEVLQKLEEFRKNNAKRI